MPIINSNKPKIFRLPLVYRNNTVNGTGENGFIEGRILNKGVPVSRRVMCFHRRTGQLISTCWSDADGYYRFDNLTAGIKVFITSVDDTVASTMQKAVTGDFITVADALHAGDL